MFTEQVLKLIDVALDLDDDKKADVDKILNSIKLTIEIGSVLASGISLVIDAHSSPEKSDAERTQAILDLQDKLDRYMSV
ncbi:MAG: hypothetical protein COB09_19075 [Thalassobium sp.]|nr:MAG: hypothetical protein COB09_19075 [Thalassobium sp.]